MSNAVKPQGGCENTRVNQWCNNQDVKRVKLRSRAAGVHGTNLYEGAELLMCAECRRANNGGFKLLK